MAKRSLIFKQKLENFQNFSCKFRCSFNNDAIFALLAFGVLARIKMCRKKEVFEAILIKRLEKVPEKMRKEFKRVYEADKRVREDQQVLNFQRDEVCEEVVEVILKTFKEMIKKVVEDEIIKERIENNYLLCEQSLLAVFRRFSSVFRIAVVFFGADFMESSSFDFRRSCPVVVLHLEDDMSFSLLCHQEISENRGNGRCSERFPFFLTLNNLPEISETLTVYQEESKNQVQILKNRKEFNKKEVIYAVVIQ